MYPEVEAYLKTADAAEEAYRVAVGPAEVAYARNRDYSAYREVQCPAEQERTETVKAAWAVLGDTSPDPLVGHIVLIFGSMYLVNGRYGNAEKVLCALPLDYDGLVKFAADQGWCGDFDDYLDEAVEAGVVAAPARHSIPAVKELMQWFREEVSSSRLERNQLATMLDAVVAEVKGEALDEPVTPGDSLDPADA
jgi:hypothetical protein